MSKAPNFASILDESPEEVRAPSPLPAGTYLTVVIGTPVYDKSTQKKTDYVEFTFRPIAAEVDVDEDELSESGGLEGKTLKNKYWLTEDAVFMLDQFHEHCGIDLTDGESRRHRNDAVINSEVRVVITHTTSQDGQRIFANISRTLPAD